MFGGFLMTEFILHVGSTILCPHNPAEGIGQVTQFITTNIKVFVSGQAVVTQDYQYTITGCTQVPPITPPPPPKPCLSIKWTSPAEHILINGHHAILQNSNRVRARSVQSVQIKIRQIKQM